MGNTCATSLTTLAMLDALEAGISALRSQCVSAPAFQAGTAGVLEAELCAAGLSTGEFARLACVPQDMVEAWATGNRVAPPWVTAAIRLVALLTPSARYKLLNSSAHAYALTAEPTQCHPFSRIEEL